MLMPDGVYLDTRMRPEYVRTAQATPRELREVVVQTGRRLGQQPQRRGILLRDADSGYLELKPGR